MLEELTGQNLRTNDFAFNEDTVKLLSHTLKSVTQGINITDMNNNIIFVNQAFLDIYGYSEEEVLNKNINIVRADNDINYREISSGTITGGWHGELLNRKKDGTVFPIYLSTSVVRNEKSEPIALVGVVTNITERKRSEAILKKSEQEYRNLFESANDAIVIFEPESEIILDVNNRACITYGFSREELIGMSMKVLSKNVQRGEIQIKELLRKGTYEQFESEQFRRDGSIIHLLINASVIDFNGKLAVLSINRDITERKQTEQTLKESEKKYRDLIEKTLDGVYKSTHAGKFLEVNPALVKMLGYDSKEDLMSIDIKTQLYFDSSDRESAALQEKLEEMAVFRLKKKDGSAIWVEDHGRHILDEKGNVLYHEGIMRDVTERINTELQLQKFTAELKASNATKDKFFSILAHDLRGPFTGLMGITEDLAKNIDKLEKEEIVEYANIMHSTSQKIYELLTNLLEWSRLQTGRIEFNPQKINLFEETESIRNLYSSAAAGKSICIFNKTEKDAFALADKNMVSAIFRNLISNALKFTNPGGIICIESQTGENHVEISINDTGIGLTDEHLDKMFRIDSGFITTKGTAGETGTGFGLVLCKEMIEKNGGQIHVESVPAKGTKFIFTLPYA